MHNKFDVEPMTGDKIVEPRLLRGFRDYLPAHMIARLKIIATIRRVYELYGFQPLETPAQEFRETFAALPIINNSQNLSRMRW